MLRVLELFGGIGACTTALERLGIEHNVVDYVEIDKYACASFNAIHGTNFEPQDICEWDKDIECDLIMHGSPCQDFSIAGRQSSGDEGSGTRSSLMWETVRIIGALRPKYVIWENVKNVISPKHRHNFDKYLNALSDLGYTNHWKIMNAKDYGVPQNRERVFTVSIRNDIQQQFEFPEPFELEVRLKDVLEPVVDEKYYLDGKYESVTEVNETYSMLNGGTIGKMHDISRRVYNEDGYAPTIPTCCGGNIEPKVAVAMRGRYNDSGEVEQRIEISNREYANTITTVQKDSMICEPVCLNSKGGRGGVEGLQPSLQDRVYDSNAISTAVTTSYMPKFTHGKRIRKLTPKECWRLMGFTDEEFAKAEGICSRTQLLKQAGNSIVVDCLVYIFKNLLPIKEPENEYRCYICGSGKVRRIDSYEPSDLGMDGEGTITIFECSNCNTTIECYSIKEE